jgi:hypothetical protein
MELERFLNLCAAGIGTLGSIYVLKNFLSLSPGATANLARQKWDIDISAVDSLSAQRAESLTGAFAFLLALLFGIGGTSGVASQFVLRGSEQTGYAAVALTVGAVWLCLHFTARRLRKRHGEAARMVILTETFDDVVNKRKFESAYLDGVSQTATALFGMRFDDMSRFEMMSAVAAKTGRVLPTDAKTALGSST